jgi:hypothetical protein
MRPAVRPHICPDWISVRLPESRLKTKLIAVEGDGLIDVADDEEW